MIRFFFIIFHFLIIGIISYQLIAQQLLVKEYDAPQQEIISRYLVFGENVAKRGKIQFFEMGNAFYFHRFALWAASQGLSISSDQPPFANNMLQVLENQGAKLLLEPIDLGRENWLCFDFAQLQYKTDRSSLSAWQGELLIRVSGTSALRLTMPVKHFVQTPCVNLNAHSLPEKPIVVELIPNHGQGHFWGIYDLYLLHRFDYNPWPKLEKYSGWPLNLQ